MLRVARHPQRDLDNLVREQRSFEPILATGQRVAVVVVPELIHLETRERPGGDVLDRERGHDVAPLPGRARRQIADLSRASQDGDETGVILDLVKERTDLGSRRPHLDDGRTLFFSGSTASYRGRADRKQTD